MLRSVCVVKREHTYFMAEHYCDNKQRGKYLYGLLYGPFQLFLMSSWLAWQKSFSYWNKVILKNILNQGFQIVDNCRSSTAFSEALMCSQALATFVLLISREGLREQRQRQIGIIKLSFWSIRIVWKLKHNQGLMWLHRHWYLRDVSATISELKEGVIVCDVALQRVFWWSFSCVSFLSKRFFSYPFFTSRPGVIGNSANLWYFAEMWISFDTGSEQKYFTRWSCNCNLHPLPNKEMTKTEKKSKRQDYWQRLVSQIEKSAEMFPQEV